MGLNFDLVGQKSDPMVHRYTWRDCALYALGVGATVDGELDVLYEKNGPVVLPTFSVVPSFTALIDTCRRLRADFSMILHGEQTIIPYKPIPPNGEFVTVAEVQGIYDKGKGALAVIATETADETGEPVFGNVFSVFIRGAGNFGGDRGPEAVQADPPDGAEPVFAVSETTSASQAALYRLSGDYNPLHIDPAFATAVGFEQPILHGLCTYGYCGRAILRQLCGGDPARLRRFSARFSGTVTPGEPLTTKAWKLDENRYALRVFAGDDRLVLTNSIVEIA